MAITVNTLAEVPDANGYIVEVGLEDSDHPANQIDRDKIRNELEIGEWYVRTGDRSEEQQLMLQLENAVNHSRLPAYVILTSHPEEAREAVVLYLDDIDSEESAWRLLEAAISTLRTMGAKESQSIEPSELARTILAEHSLTALNISANAITIITFAGL